MSVHEQSFINDRNHDDEYEHVAESKNKNLVRFSVAMPEDLLMAFDDLVARRGLTHNRSEVIRDLVRAALVDEEWDNPEQEIVGTITMVYSHHASNLTETLDEIQHKHYKEIISTMHIHLDEHNCLEIIAMRGRPDDIHAIADALLGVKGVKHGRLTTTTTGKYL
jgi:CopG family nickel-responsive transcriptional regulator